MATLTTPTWGLPSPDGAERVMDGDNAIGALATATDTALTFVHTPQGTVVTGAQRDNIGGTPLVLPLDTLMTGAASWLNAAGDYVEIPATGVASGLFVIELYFTIVGGAANALTTTTVEVGTPGNPTALVIQSVPATGTTVRQNISTSSHLIPGNMVRISTAFPGTTGSAQVRRLTVRRVGNVLGV